MELMLNPYIVYVKTDSSGRIIAVNSSSFLSDTTGWIEIDRGFGDKYGHAQGNYFQTPICTDDGAFRYKLADGKVVECSTEEVAEQEEANVPDTPSPTLESRVETLENDSTEMREALEMILSGVTE